MNDLQCRGRLFRESSVTVFCHLVRGLPKTVFHCALLVLLAACPCVKVSAGIQQVNPLPGRPDSGTLNIVGAVSPNYASFSSTLAFDVVSGGNTIKQVLLSWQRSGDGAPTFLASRIKSTNGGLTFGAEIPDNEHMYFRAIKKRNGTILTLPFNPGTGPWTYHTSTNNGDTWITHTNGTLSVAMVIHTGFLEENNVLYTCGYSGGSAKLMKCTDGGATWSSVTNIGTVNVPSAGLSYNETNMVRCVNGSWLAVMRVETGQVMRYARSTNLGLSWTTPALLPGLTTTVGVDPRLYLLPNGVLALTYGEAAGAAGRHVKIAFSADGNGTSWTNVTTLLSAVSEVLESTGYNTLYPVGPNRFMAVYDTGSNWNYAPPYSASEYHIRGQLIDIVPTLTNRIDLKGRVAAGTASTTGLTHADAAHPEARAAGAYDGSTDYWSGAFASGTSGTYTIDLQSPLTLNAVGVCLQQNTTQSATVEISTNGSSWTTVKTYTNAAHQAIDYATFTAQSARYVRVAVTGAGPLVGLNEIELYETADTFENNAVELDTDAHGVIPPGYAWAGTSATQYGFAVRDSATNAGYQSSRSFQMWDGSSTWQAGIIKTTTAAQTKTLRFRVKPQVYGTDASSCILIPIKGTVSGGLGTPFYLLIAKDGSIKYNNGSTWTVVPNCGVNTVPTGSWTLVQIAASNTTDIAAVSVNGTFKGNATMYANPLNVTNLTGFAFASQGTTTWGEKALFDDVLLE